MAVSREKKKQIVADLTDKLVRSEALIMTDYRGLSAAEIMVKLALEQAGLPWEQWLFDGPTAIGFCYEDVPGPAKILVEFANESKTFSIRGGMLGKKLVDGAQVSDLAALPSSEVLIAQAVARMQGPLVGLIGVLSAPLQNLVYVLQARSDQLAEAEA